MSSLLVATPTAPSVRVCLVAEYFRQRKAAGYVDEWPATVLGWQRQPRTSQDFALAAVILDELGLETVIKVGCPPLHSEEPFQVLPQSNWACCCGLLREGRCLAMSSAPQGGPLI
jgi:hypothetical protein